MATTAAAAFSAAATTLSFSLLTAEKTVQAAKKTYSLATSASADASVVAAGGAWSFSYFSFITTCLTAAARAGTVVLKNCVIIIISAGTASFITHFLFSFIITVDRLEHPLFFTWGISPSNILCRILSADNLSFYFVADDRQRRFVYGYISIIGKNAGYIYKASIDILPIKRYFSCSASLMKNGKKL